jgi:hypothetical protein
MTFWSPRHDPKGAGSADVLGAELTNLVLAMRVM